MRLLVPGTVALSIGMCFAEAGAQQFTIGLSEVARTFAGGSPASEYNGVNIGRGDRRGAVLDGGSDAYDDAGYLNTDLAAVGLSLTRRTQTIASINVFRWIDTYINTSATPLDVTLIMESNLGSDSLTRTLLSEPFRTITYENRDASTDPVLAMMHGNNSFASSNTQPVLSGGILHRRITVGLDPGQSVTLMFADLLVRDLSDRRFDMALASERSAAFITNPTPLLTGLGASDIEHIANWTIPVPSTLALGPFVVVCANRRNKRRHRR